MIFLIIPLLYIIYKYLYLKQSQVSSWRFFAPFSLLFSRDTKNLQGSGLKLKYIFSELFLISASVLTASSFGNEIAHGVMLSIVSIVLMYLSVYDIFTYSVPAIVTRWGLILVVAINIVALLSRIVARYVLHTNTQFLLEWGNIGNLIGGLSIGLLFWIIIEVTKEKGLGLGDLDIVMIIGFSLGFPLVLSSFYYTLIAATVFGIALAIYLKKFHGLIIPFVPFLTFGFLLAAIFGSSLIFPSVI